MVLGHGRWSVWSPVVGSSLATTRLRLSTSCLKLARFDDELVTVTFERAARKISRYSRQLEPRVREEAYDIRRIEIRELEMHHVRSQQRAIGPEFLRADHRLE